NILFDYTNRAKARAYDFTPLSGVANSTTVFCNESGKYSVYKSDRYGFNNDNKAYDNNVQILMLGDSFAQGACVQEGEDIASRLRDWGYNTINTGMAGIGPLIELAILREYGPHLHPKKILILYYGNDIYNLGVEINHPLLIKYLDPDFSQNLFHRQPEINGFLTNFIKTRESFFSRNLVNYKNYLTLFNLRQFLGFSGTVAYNKPQLNLSSYKEVLEKILLESERLEAQLFFVYLPGLKDLAGESPVKLREEVLSIVKGLQIPIVDFFKELKKDKDPAKYFSFRMDKHYNAQGYKKLARLIEGQVLQINHQLRVGADLPQKN
ncbi:MAG TPA: hypothetical protein EYO73_07615, partial [Sulfurimonas sp.]|nr:hypothetical protein [Sulfurimonas sp.]